MPLNCSRLICLLAVAVAILATVTPGNTAVHELTREELDVDHTLSAKFPTPHIQWAKPYAQGKTRVLIFVGSRGTLFREVVELMQRFDLEAEAVLHARIVNSSKEDWHGGKEGLRRIDSLLQKDWDAYLFLGIAPAKLPEQLRLRLVGKVLAGGGVVLTGVEDAVLIPVAVEMRDEVPFLAGIAEAKAFRIGRGRALRLPARPVVEYAEGWQNAYENWQEGLGRAVIWAAGREPRGALSLALSRQNFPRTEPAVATVRWKGAAPAGPKARLQLWIRGSAGWTAPWPDREPEDSAPLEVKLPRLAAGRYHLDGRVVGPTGVEVWSTIPFEVTQGRRIAGLELKPEWGESNGRIAGRIELSEPAAVGGEVRIEVLDKERRILLREAFTAEGKWVDFDLAVPPWLPRLATVEASLTERGETVSTAYRYFMRTKRNRDQFNFLIWDVPRGTLAPYAQEMLARTGVTLQLGQGNPPLHAAAADLAWVPYTTDITAKRDTKGIMTPFCWNDRAAVEANTRKIAEKHLLSRQHGVFAYSLGDEIATQGACLAETCLETYRAYLKETYGTIEALNRSWETDFKTWETVGLSAPEDNEEKRSLETRNYSRWFDRQAFKSWNFVQYTRKYAAAYGAIDPQARTGFEGAGRFDRGDDIDLIVRNLGFWSPYPGTTDEVIRSIAPRDFQRANWMGYTKDSDSLLQKYWRMVTRGMDSVWWWRWECIGRFNGWLAPDLRPYPAVQEILTDTRVVREGLGDLLLKSRMEDDGIAILYSYPSTFAHKLEEGSAFEGYEKSHTAWHKALCDLGLRFSYVTDRMLRLGEFEAGRLRVLILPRAEAIGVKEAAVIWSFVEGGGVVIADTRPGLYDDHCKRKDTGILDDLFGVRRKGFPSARKAAGALVDPGIEVVNGTVRENFGQTLNSETVNSSQFSELAGVPVLVGRKVGKGYALLINGDLNVLDALGKSGMVPGGGAVQRSLEGEIKIQKGDRPAVLGGLLERLAGVRPAVGLSREDGGHVRDVEVVRWRNGENEIIALFRQGGKGETVTVELPRTAQVYDLRNRKALGGTRIFKTAILPNRASFFVLTPKPAPPVQMKIDAEMLGVAPTAPAKVAKAKGKGPAAYAPGTLMKVRLGVPGAQGDHAVLVTARFPKPPAEPPRSGAFFPRTGYPAMPAVFSPTLRSLDTLGTGAGQGALRQAHGDTGVAQGDMVRPLDTLGTGLANDALRQAQGDKEDVMLSLSKHDPFEPFVYPGVDPEKGEFLKRVEILGRNPVTVDVPIAYNDPPGTYELTVTDLFTQKTTTQTWRVQ